MNAFLKGPVLRALLGLLALVVVGLAVWFLGPFVAFDELRPLATVGMRVTTLVLLFAAVLSWLLRVPFVLVGVAALCVLVWHAGPLLALGTLRPLEAVWARVLCIGLILLALLVWGLFKLYRMLQDDEQLLQKWLKRDPASQPLAREEIKALSQVARRSVAQLRQMHTTMAGGTGSVWAGLRRVVEGKRYLYELPWYVVIGKPGAGKSTMVLNSGLRFPLADQMGTASARLTLERAAGTRNCDWWLTNEAVLLDTAGRYTDPSVGAAAADKPVVIEGETSAESTTAPDAAAHLRRFNEAEWRGFLGVLRRIRPRAPVNGALLVVDAQALLEDEPGERLAHAARLREQLAQLRTHLGIRFPVYVVLTKVDVLRGFVPYFSSLTSEARAQVWGMTLPWGENGPGSAQDRKGWWRRKTAPDLRNEGTQTDAPAQANWPLPQQLAHEFEALVRRVRDGVATRLQEEFELDQRQALYVLPDELAALQDPLIALLDAVFADSRYDTTQLHHMLRGVYLTSTLQPAVEQPQSAERRSLVARLRKGLAELGQSLGVGGGKTASGASAAGTKRSYFVTDALMRVVFAESHLVKPNLRWEARTRLLRWMGHGAVLVVFFWLSGALTLSYHNNSGYLKDVSEKTAELTQQMQQWLSQPSMGQSEKVLGLAQALPSHGGLDLSDPSSSFLYGLYVADPIAAQSEEVYGQLMDRLVLPVVIERMEQVMREAVDEGDAKRAYETLRAYLMLHDAQRYTESDDGAQAVRQWVTQDWQDVREPVKAAGAQGLAQRFNNSTAMVGHLEWLFSGKRVVQSASGRNEGLVAQVRAFLDKNSSSERLYERAKSSLMEQAPQGFSLVRALGPQAGTLFSRASGETLESGVPGLFTYDGYHDVFAKRLPDMLAAAQRDDAWVMGRQDGTRAVAEKKTLEPNAAETRELMEEIRRQYLSEYAQIWTEFLGDIRLVKGDPSGTLAFELNVLRQLAAADSPLVRLGRLAARETTLSRPLLTDKPDKSIFDKAADQVEQQTSKVNKGLGLRPEQRAERQWVDDRFSALREVVTGQPGNTPALPGAKAGLDSVTNALNEFYTVLVVADTAISAGSLPPAGSDAAMRLRIEAGKLPAPLREILMDVSNSGTDKVGQGASSILRVQARAQMDRLVGLMAVLVSEPCQRNIAGRYPFAPSEQEVSVDDFNALFAAGGAADEYFSKYLAPLVDTSARPWRYKSPQSAQMLVGTEGVTQGAAPTAAPKGPTLMGELLSMLAQGGPNPDVFAQIGQIRDMFFREAGAKRMSWRGEYKVVALDPSVTELVIDIDGQAQRYSHGPVQAVPLQWPGPRGGTMAELHAHPRIKTDTSSLQLRGPWAWMRLVERGKIAASAQSNRIPVEFLLDNRRALLEISSAGPSPFNSSLLRNFACPGRAS